MPLQQAAVQERQQWFRELIHDESDRRTLLAEVPEFVNQSWKAAVNFEVERNIAFGDALRDKLSMLNTQKGKHFATYDSLYSLCSGKKCFEVGKPPWSGPKGSIWGQLYKPTLAISFQKCALLLL